HYKTAIIAYPHIHDLATEDVGSYEHPSTFACEEKFIKPGTIIYVPRLQKYYIMEDGCAECSDDWTRDRTKHVDLYIGGQKLGGKDLIDRENALTLDGPEIIIVHPPKNLPVDIRPLFV
ncbi:MAG TPA: carbohydrate-binding protein, partial [bacterium]